MALSSPSPTGTPGIPPDSNIVLHSGRWFALKRNSLAKTGRTSWILLKPSSTTSTNPNAPASLPSTPLICGVARWSRSARTKEKKLISPSCSNDRSGQAWIEDFMARVRDIPPDHFGLHYYGMNGSEAIGFIQSMHDKFPKQQGYLL
ncbi:hypothetical protein DPV78_001990 [Talaromyces pinophilus]|nr:hypothetical protein DPV78_001990 [Talaromyces pinophilus]